MRAAMRQSAVENAQRINRARRGEMGQTAIVLAVTPAALAPAAQAGWSKFVEMTHNTIANKKRWEKPFAFGKVKGCENE